MEEYKKKTNTGDDVFIRLQKPKEPAPGTIPDDGQDHSLPRPTAVLLGWFAAKHKNLSKYGAIYEDMGYNVVQVIAPASVVFPLKPQYTAAFTLSLLRIIAADSHLTNGGIVFMMFSNGGAINAPHLSRMFTGEYQEIIKADDEPAVKTVREAVAGIIFDSAPCYMRSHLGARAINEGLKLPEGLRRAEYLCPELYIYSTADHLSDIPSLEALVEERKQQGKEVRVFRVEDAGHVMILRNHHQKYVDTIRAVNDWGVNPYRSKAGLRPWLLQENDKS